MKQTNGSGTHSRDKFDPDSSRGIKGDGTPYRVDEAYGSHNEELSSDYDRGERPGTQREAENPHGAGVQKAVKKARKKLRVKPTARG